MDGFGYKNWGSTHDSLNESGSGYDFVVDSPEYDRGRQSASKGPTTKPTASRFQSQEPVASRFGGTATRRSSIDDRTKEILERNRSRVRETKQDDESQRYNSLEAEFAEILQGIEIPKVKESAGSPSASFLSGKSSNAKHVAESPSESTYDDSFDISAADFEVGGYAAKRMNEKATERGRRMSFDQSAFISQKDNSFLNAKNSASPDVRGRRSSVPEGFQMSTALSSIQKSRSSGVDASRPKTGSDDHVERSDDDIYRMLNASARDADSRRGLTKQSYMDRDSRDSHNLVSQNSNDSHIHGINDSRSYDDEHFEANNDDDYDMDNSPHRPPVMSLPSGNQHKAVDDGDEDEYADDFDGDAPVSIRKDEMIAPPRSPTLAAKLFPSTSSKELPRRAPAVSEDDGLTTVEKIMQRWSNTDSNRIALDLICRTTTEDDEQDLREGRLPAAIESPMIPRKHFESKHADTELSNATEVFQDADNPSVNTPQTNSLFISQSAGPNTLLSNPDEVAHKPLETESKPLAVVHTEDSLPHNLFAAVGDAHMVSSIPAFDIPTWTPGAAVGVASPDGNEELVDSFLSAGSSSTASLSVSDEQSKQSMANEAPVKVNEVQADPPQSSTLVEFVGSNIRGSRSTRYKVESDDELLPNLIATGASAKQPIAEQIDNKLVPNPMKISVREGISPPQGQQTANRETEGKGLSALNNKASMSSLELIESHNVVRDGKKKTPFASSTAEKLMKRRNNATHEDHNTKKLTRRQNSPMRRGEAVASSSTQEELLEKLKKDNQRLSRKFSELEQSLGGLKRSQSISRARSPTALVAENSHSAHRGALDTSKGSVDNKHSLFRDSVERHSDNANFVKAMTVALHHLQQHQNHTHEEEIQHDLQVLVRQMLEQSYQLQDRERAIGVREKAAEVREQVLMSREMDINGAPGDKAYSEVRDKWMRCEQEKAVLVEQLQLARSANIELATSLDEARAKLLSLQDSDEKRSEEEARAAAGLSSCGTASKTSKPLEKILRDLKSERLEQEHYHRKHRKPGVSEAKAIPITEEDTVSVGKKEFEDIVRDCVTQERLIVGFQKENERLMKLVKDKESEEQARSARYLIEKEDLNKELNRLRNVRRVFTNEAIDADSRSVIVSTQQKTAEQLRLELDMDSRFRQLQERHAELRKESSDRERHLIAEVEAQKREVAQLQQLNEMLSNRSLDDLENQLKMAREEIVRQREKIAWYTRNQQFSDESDAANKELKKTVHMLSEQLVRRGLSAGAIKALIEKQKRSPSGPVDILDKTTESVYDSPQQQSTQLVRNRNYADVKKIRELESTIRDLQDSIAKRFPDSVAGLIHASKLEDIQQERQVKLLEVQLARAQEEIVDLQQTHEKAIRSLRLEHERLRAQYETRLGDLEKQSKALSSSPQRGAALHSAEVTEDLAAAMQKIASFQLETDRIRTFYTRKLEDQQRKFDNQIRMMRRGDSADETVPPPPPLPQPAANDENISAIVDLYKQRSERLEKELMASAEEIGKLRGAISAKDSEIERLQSICDRDLQSRQNDTLHTPIANRKELEVASPPSSAGSVVSREDIDKMIADRVESISRQLDLERQREVDGLRKDYENRLRTIESQTATGQWAADREHYLREIAEEKSKSASLLQEVVFLKQHQQSDNKNPSLMQFQIMEKQLLDVEHRLARRDRELSSTIEEVKNSAKLERARLESLHAQELQEKDQQLLQFQLELEKLLQEFHQLQKFAYAKITLPSSDAGEVKMF